MSRQPPERVLGERATPRLAAPARAAVALDRVPEPRGHVPDVVVETWEDYRAGLEAEASVEGLPLDPGHPEWVPPPPDTAPGADVDL